MRLSSRLTAGLSGLVLAGCSVLPSRPASPAERPAQLPAPNLVLAAYAEVGEKLPAPKDLGKKQEAVGAGKPGKQPPRPDLRPHVFGQVVGLPDLIALTLQRNPRLAQVGWAIDAARGRAVQAGLCPNPTVSFTGNELADRAGFGILSLSASQEVVSAGKLGLSQAAAGKEADQATLNVAAERYRVFTEVRQAFYEALTIQRRVEILESLVELAGRSVASAETLLKAKEAARLDVAQLEVDLERYRAELESTRRALPAAVARLAASVGVAELPGGMLAGGLDALPPDHDLDRLRAYVVAVHPEVRSAQIGVERAKLLLQRAEVEPHPNVTVTAGYTYQGQNRSNDFDLGVSVPVPCWNRNQGNILAARAQVGEALEQVGRAQSELAQRLAAAYGTYAAARTRAERFRAAVLPRAQETYQLARKAYQGGQFDYLRVVQAQRAVAEAELELVRSLGEMWRAAAEVAGLMLEDDFPCIAPAAPARSTP